MKSLLKEKQVVDGESNLTFPSATLDRWPLKCSACFWWQHIEMNVKLLENSYTRNIDTIQYSQWKKLYYERLWECSLFSLSRA